MNKMKVFSLLLMLVLLFSIVSCNNTSGTSSKITTPASKQKDILNDNLPKRDMGGKKFTFYIGSSAFNRPYIADEETGDLINDAVYKRNLAIEERFHVDLNFVKGVGSTGGEIGNTTNLFRSYVQAGDNSYDVYVHVQHAGMPALIQENMFVDWKTLKYVNLEKPWWYQNIKRDLCFGNKVYVMTGDISLYVGRSECLVFNKNMCDTLGLDYPYEKVKDKKWTYDEFLKMCQTAASDINGDQVMKKEDDRYGYSGWSWEMLPALYIGMGATTVEKDAKNLPVLSMNNERTFSVLDKIVNLFKQEGVAWCNSNIDLYNMSTVKMFEEGRSLFCDATLEGITSYRNMKDDFGVIPYPMLDEAQGEYYSRSPNFTGLLYIPVTNTNLDDTGIILEAMTAESYKNVTPVLFDTVLTVKGTRDNESAEMLPLIRDSSRFWYEGFVGAGDIKSLVESGENNFASTYASNESKYIESLNKLRDFYKKK